MTPRVHRILAVRPDGLARVFAREHHFWGETAHPGGWLIRWVYAESVASVTERCPGIEGMEMQSLAVWS